MTTFPRSNVLGVGVSAITMQDALAAFDDWIANGKHHYVCVRDVHGVVRSQGNERLLRIHREAGLVTPDGMPLVWLSRLDGFRHVERVYGPDLMLACCEHSIVKGYRHYFYGGAEGVAEMLAQRLKQRFPALNVVGTYTPPFRPLTAAEDADVVQRINDSGADIVWVGLSTPKQEYWMSEHVDRLDAAALVGVGAAFDFHAGVKRQAPRWMQHSGLEWVFRLATEPRRLGPRYLVHNPRFIWAVLLQKLNLRRYEM